MWPLQPYHLHHQQTVKLYKQGLGPMLQGLYLIFVSVANVKFHLYIRYYEELPHKLYYCRLQKSWPLPPAASL
jgi:hypothetical protein